MSVETFIPKSDNPFMSRLRIPLALFAISAVAIATFWWVAGAAVPMPPSPLQPAEKLYCVSYAPFRAGQSPLDQSTRIDPRQIDEDMARLAQITDCVRTYSVEFGQDQVPEIAQRHGLKVMQGLWLSSNAQKNRVEVETTIALANRYPQVIRAIVVGNEVLLRGEMSPIDLGNTIRGVKAKVPVPVTYADVWEFWMRHRELAPLVDFMTIHILPYWEDFPIPADQAAPHVLSISRKVAESFPGKEIVIGETGWPSAGRMREGALPSPVAQARVAHEVLALAKREQYRVNLIEAFDQPWKRHLEGTVGGHWGLLDAQTRSPKFYWGAPVSAHPLWPWLAAGGIVLSGLTFAAAAWAQMRRPPVDLAVWAGIALGATAAGSLIGWTMTNLPVESLDAGAWLRNGVIAAVALVAPPLAAAGLASGRPLPGFARVLGAPGMRAKDPLSWAIGAALIVLSLMAIQVALGLVFDPRYRDFPFAPLTAATVPLLVYSLVGRRSPGKRAAAEIAAAGVLVLSTIYIGFNETYLNWQAMWLCAVLLGLAVILFRLRDAPG